MKTEIDRPRLFCMKRGHAAQIECSNVRRTTHQRGEPEKEILARVVNGTTYDRGMKRFLMLTLLSFSCSFQIPTSGIRILGVAQDGGRPQLGCEKSCCSSLQQRQRVTALEVRSQAGWLMLDATPDFPLQVQEVGRIPDAIVLTHAHMGHYTGLLQLGREVMGADHVPVWCSARMAHFLRDHGPWSQLVTLGNIELHEFQDGVAFSPFEGVVIQPISVPHRDEFSDTFGFSIEVDDTKTLYIPDIDAWEPWGRLPELVRQHDFALLDATFFDDFELPGRDMTFIPHPRAVDTMDLLGSVVQEEQVQVLFTHLNHTNPLWLKDSSASRLTRSLGFAVARRGMWLTRDSLRAQKQP